MLSNISFDIDGMWSALEFLKIYSDPKKDIVLEEGVPIILDILKKEDINGLFFLVGKNVENYPELHKRIAEHHEVGNHSYSHNNKLFNLSNEDIKKEITKCHYLIKKHAKVTPKYFRSPRYQINDYMLKELDKLNYKCDSSFMPSYFPGITPVKNLFLKRKPHRIGKKIVEVPISVNPIVPIHVNGTSVLALGIHWLKFSMKMLKKFNMPLIINFHGVDSLETPNVINKHRKRLYTNPLPLLKNAINYINKNSRVVSMEEIAERLA